MEVQLVRVNVIERFAAEDEVGLTPRTLEDDLVVDVRRPGEDGGRPLSVLDEKIREGDVLISLASGIARSYVELERLGRIAKELDIKLSLHTPYYMDLGGSDELCARSMDSIRWGGLMAHELGASVVVTHLGLYGSVTPRTAFRRMLNRVQELGEWYDRAKLGPKLGLETSGRQEVFGTLSEVVRICGKVKRAVPVLNFAHIHAREGGSLRTPEDFRKVIEKAEPFADGHIHSHFSGVEHEGGNELRYTPIKKGDLRFEPLAECILDGEYDITLISGSPLLEHDAMYMKVLTERLLAKRVAKENKKEAKS
jgi:deoxyribonuclease-4